MPELCITTDVVGIPVLRITGDVAGIPELLITGDFVGMPDFHIKCLHKWRYNKKEVATFELRVT